MNADDTGGSDLVAIGTIDLTDVLIEDDPYGNDLTSTELPIDNFSEDNILIDVTPPILESITNVKINDGSGDVLVQTPHNNTTTWAKKDDVIKFTLNFNDLTRLYGSATITVNTGTTVNPTLSVYNESGAPFISDPEVAYTVQELSLIHI